MSIATNLGYPRIGLHRELKKALESYWEEEIILEELERVGNSIRLSNWKLQNTIGIKHIPSNDFSLYDHVLDTAIMLGAIPERFCKISPQVTLDTYFAMARGSKNGLYENTSAMEMTKWFNTNYHYIVPEITPDTEFKLNPAKPLNEFLEASKIDILTRPVILGPLSFLILSKSPVDHCSPLQRVNDLIPLYLDLLSKFKDIGAEWIQIDEPCLAFDLPDSIKREYKKAYLSIGQNIERPKILLTEYFASMSENIELACSLPVDGLHIDLINGQEQLEPVLEKMKKGNFLSLGIIDGHNVWKTDLDKTIQIIKIAEKRISKEQLFIAPSCSLLHVPQDISIEESIAPEFKRWLSFAYQKLQEIVTLTKAINFGLDVVKKELDESREIDRNRRSSQFLNNPTVRNRLKHISSDMLKRKNPFAIRHTRQQQKLQLPILPTTTIGSFPQTEEVRNKRDQLSKGQISLENYKTFIKNEIVHLIQFQEKIGLDVFVHGEFERNDMVQYFAEQLTGFIFTKNGWVQSYGSRYVRPPIIYGDVSRPHPISVEWSQFSQSQTDKPVKGMLTGPITILNWSFVRDDQPHADTCRQIALAMRDEVVDLEKVGIGVIQIDEPAMRESLPLHQNEWPEYLNWAVECFHLTACGVKDETQIHTHMCYSEFNDIIQAIAELDADVISIEATRSKMEFLKAFSNYHYPNDIGPGVYDIHSPRIPTEQEIYDLLRNALNVVPASQLWINPDCGLKTRHWDEVEPSLRAMMSAVYRLRSEIKKGEIRG